MKTEKELNYDILKITMRIEELFPELSKFIGEMPVSMSYNIGKEISITSLKDYYDSLDTFLKRYAIYHNKLVQ